MSKVPMRLQDMYSVFVGHINPETKKMELLSVFKQVGMVVDLFMVDRNNGGYNYGFVRYAEASEALRAVSELNGWVIHGVALVVDISKDTSEKIDKERIAGAVAKKLEVVRAPPSKPMKKSSSAPTFSASKATNYLQDTMYLSRVKESCTALNLGNSQDTDEGSVNSRQLLEDVGYRTVCRGESQSGQLHQPVNSFQDISNRIMTRCSQAGEGGCVFGSRKTEEFTASLNTIMTEIHKFINASAECQQCSGIADNCSGQQEQTEDTGTLDSVSDTVQAKSFSEQACGTSDISDDDLTALGISVAQSGRGETATKESSTVDQDCQADLSGMSLSDCHRLQEVGQCKFDDHCVQTDTSDFLEQQESEAFEKNMMTIDPAILALQASPEIPSVKGSAFSRDDPMSPIQSGRVPLARSNSQGSSFSDDSIEGVNDSGVETDFIGSSQKPKSSGERDKDNVLSPQFLEEYIMKARGRGRGMGLLSSNHPVAVPRGRGDNLSAILKQGTL